MTYYRKTHNCVLVKDVDKFQCTQTLDKYDTVYYLKSICSTLDQFSASGRILVDFLFHANECFTVVV